MPSYIVDESGRLKLKNKIFSNEVISRLESFAKLNKILSDLSKLKILHLLDYGETNVTEIIREIGSSQSLISHHLATLRQEKLVTKRRSSKIIYYSLSSLGKNILDKFAC